MRTTKSRLEPPLSEMVSPARPSPQHAKADAHADGPVALEWTHVRRNRARKEFGELS